MLQAASRLAINRLIVARRVARQVPAKRVPAQQVAATIRPTIQPVVSSLVAGTNGAGKNRAMTATPVIAAGRNVAASARVPRPGGVTQPIETRHQSNTH